MASKPRLYVVVNNHFDPTWRRCWDRRMVCKGDSFVSYAELQDYYMTDNLALARRSARYKFEAESTIVARQYVRRHPQRLAELRKLAAAGRFAVTGAGDNIVDSNMPLGESIIRNFLTGLLWVEDNLGQATRLGVRNDGFGNSAQMPQILRGCEIEWVTGVGYSPIRGRYWRGLDGSAVCTATLPVAAAGGGCDKYAPCRKCRGAGCRACAGRGIELNELCNLPAEIEPSAIDEYGCAQVRLTPEELLPDPGVFAWARRLGRAHDVRFAVEEEFLPHLRPWLDRVDDPPADEVHPSVEANPNNSGVWVTRIRTKQQCRRQEHALLAAETLASLAALAGAKVPRPALARVWEDLLFTMFHDAITATHVDAAYEEIRDKWAAIDRGTAKVRDRALGRLVRPRRGVVSVINPTGAASTQVVSAEVKASSAGLAIVDEAGRAATVLATRKLGGGRAAVEFVAADVPALGAKVYRVSPAQAPRAARRLRRPVIQNERFRVEADEHGIVAIHDRKLGATIAAADEYRPNELVLEHDEGSPWATLQPDRHRIALGEHTRLVAAEATAGRQRLIFECTPPHRFANAGGGLSCDTVVTLRRGLARVDFSTCVRWNTFNYRLRVAMPLTKRGKGVYGIPYGMIQRAPYEPSYHWAGANGDWPAVEWAGVQATGRSVALLNRGLPSYLIEPGRRRGQVIFLSVLRSPTLPTYLHEPWSYTMTDYDGMRDEGHHGFEYALTAYAQPFADSDVVHDATGYNAGLLAVEGEANLPAAPTVRSEHVRLAALKWAEKGRALILRLWEFRGRQGAAEVALPPRVRKAARVNMLERRARPLPIKAGRLTVPVRPWEIATLRLEL